MVPVDRKSAARSLLAQRVAELREQSFAELRDAWLNEPDCEQVTGPDGREYQIEIDAFWNDRGQENLRVWVSVWGGGRWGIAGMPDSFVIAPDGTFLYE
jgi:hypothetical protein